MVVFLSSVAGLLFPCLFGLVVCVNALFTFMLVRLILLLVYCCLDTLWWLGFDFIYGLICCGLWVG